MAPLWQTYVGGGISPKTGASDAAVSSLLAVQRRRKLLEQAINKGAIKPQQLSPDDASVLGLSIPKPADSGFLTGASRFFSNLLGERGLYGMATHIPGGVAATASSIWEDLAHRGQPGYHSQVQSKIVKPTLQGFKEDATSLGELATGHPKRFLEAPLNPLLDLGSVVSGGATLAGKAGGSLARMGATRVGEEGVTGASRLGEIGQRLARITSTEGRAPTITGIPRDFSSSPTMKLGQIAGDKLTLSSVGRKLNLPAMQEKRALNKLIDITHGEKAQTAAHEVSTFSAPVARALNEMSPPERVAVTYSLMGVNSPGLAQAFRTQLEESLSKAHEASLGHDVEGPHMGDFARDLVNPSAAEVQVRYLSDPNIVGLISQPTDSMRRFAQIWDQYVRGRHETLGIDPRLHEGHIGELQKSLAERLPEDRSLWEHLTTQDTPYTPDGGITPSYVPSRAARDFEMQTGGKLSSLTGGRLFSEPYFGRNRLDKATSFLGRIRPLEPLRNPIAPYLHESSLDTVLSGAARVDPKLFLEHIRQVEEDILSRQFNASTIEKLGFKDGRGLRTFRATGEMNSELVERMREARAWGDPNWKQWDPRNWVLIHPDMPVRWYREGHNAVAEVMRGLGPNAAVTPALERLLQDRAREFWINSMGATRAEGYAIPRQAFDRLQANLNVNRPYNNRLGNLYASLLNKWRSFTLAYMPRWLVNTAVGSAFMAVVKGVVNPRHYLQAARLTKDDALPARVRLGGVIHGEALEPGSRVGIGRFSFAEASFHTVQSVEDFFRSSSFVQSLEKAAKQHMAETGTIIDGYRPFWNENRTQYIDHLISDHPELVKKAVDDVDKFAYNFTSLSPNERRYVRLLIPFWGWYKFISKLMYRLPVEFPARTRAMSAVSEIGKTVEQEVGPIPEWIKGSIILGRDKDGHIRYLPTLGLNPMSQFLNPFGDEGKIGGILRLGQLNPGVQGILSGLGVSTLDAGQVPLSPQSGVGQDYFGRLTDAKTGASTTAAAHGGLARFAHSILTSIPQVRIGELIATGGKPVYPESIPFVDERIMPSQKVSRRDVSGGGVLQQYFGVQPRTYDVKKYQQQLPRRAQYVKTRLKNQRKSLRKDK